MEIKLNPQRPPKETKQEDPNVARFLVPHPNTVKIVDILTAIGAGEVEDVAKACDDATRLLTEDGVFVSFKTVDADGKPLPEDSPLAPEVMVYKHRPKQVTRDQSAGAIIVSWKGWTDRRGVFHPDPVVKEFRDECTEDYLRVVKAQKAEKAPQGKAQIPVGVKPEEQFAQPAPKVGGDQVVTLDP